MEIWEVRVSQKIWYPVIVINERKFVARWQKEKHTLIFLRWRSHQIDKKNHRKLKDVVQPYPLQHSAVFFLVIIIIFIIITLWQCYCVVVTSGGSRKCARTHTVCHWCSLMIINILVSSREKQREKKKKIRRENSHDFPPFQTVFKVKNFAKGFFSHILILIHFFL